MTEFEQRIIEQLSLLNANFKSLIERGGIVGGVSPALSVQKQYTLFEWFEKWLETEHKPNVKDTVYKNDCGIMKNHIYSKPQFNKTLSEFKQLDLQELINSIEFPRQRVIAANMVTAALRSAYNNDLMIKDITVSFKKPSYESKEDRALTHEEERKLLKALHGYFLEPYILTLLFAGLRRNEALGLQRKHIDFENDNLYIDQQVDGNNEFTPILKTKTSKRVIKLFPTLKSALSQFKPCASEVRLFDYKPDYVTRKFTEFCVNSNIPCFTLKSCRTTFATRCEEMGIADTVIQKWLGHSTIKTTKKHYIKVNPEFVENEFVKVLKRAK